jgi:hypothetical protein
MVTLTGWDCSLPGRVGPPTSIPFTAGAPSCLNFSAGPCLTSPLLHDHLLWPSSTYSQTLWQGVPRFPGPGLFSSSEGISISNNRPSLKMVSSYSSLQSGEEQHFFTKAGLPHWSSHCLVKPSAELRLVGGVG